MIRNTRPVPKWLQQLLAEYVPVAGHAAAHCPRWQESLWPHVWAGQPRGLLLRGTLHYPAEMGTSGLRSTRTGVRCGLGRPVVSPKGIHGLHLYLADEKQPAEALALLLTPTAFTHLQSDRASKHSDVRTHSLNEPFVILETERLRAEFTPRDRTYDPAHPHLELLRSLTLEVVVWQRSPSPPLS